MDWQAYLAQLGIIVTAVPCIGAFSYFTGKAIIDRWFKAREQSYQFELDRLSKRDEIRFSTLHAKRAEVIGIFYQRLAVLNDSGRNVIHIKRNPDAIQKCFLDSLDDVTSEFSLHRIYFSISLCGKIQEFITRIRNVGYVRIALRDLAESNNDSKELQEAAGEDLKMVIDKEIPILLRAVETEFRQLLGVEDK